MSWPLMDALHLPDSMTGLLWKAVTHTPDDEGIIADEHGKSRSIKAYLLPL